MTEQTWKLGEIADFNSPQELLTTLLQRDSKNYVYRGQADYIWPVSSTISRTLILQAENGGPIKPNAYISMVPDLERDRHSVETEDRLLREFITESERLGFSDLPGHLDRLGWWELMQHHGAPTRLLDWSRSPLIALWFAVNDTKVSEEADASIFVLNVYNTWLSHAKWISTLSAQDSSWNDVNSDRVGQNRLAEYLIHHKPTQVPLVIEPRRTVPRVVAQQSLMTLMPEIALISSNYLTEILSTKIRIPAHWKEEIRHKCLQRGLTRFSLFRDLDTLGAELKYLLEESNLLSPTEEALREHKRLLEAAKGQNPPEPSS